MAEQISADFVRQTRLALEVLAGETAMSPTNELAALVGAAAKAYLHAIMNTQSTDLALDDHVEFDVELENDGSGAIALSSGGANQTDGLITLAADKTYKVLAALRMGFSDAFGIARLKWRNNTGAAFFGNQAEVYPMNRASATGDLNIAGGIIPVGASPIVIELRFTHSASLSSILGSNAAAADSFVLVEEIG